nr:MAG TPA: hypothetical protein [Caudoviricetes sp.]
MNNGTNKKRPFARSQKFMSYGLELRNSIINVN